MHKEEAAEENKNEEKEEDLDLAIQIKLEIYKSKLNVGTNLQRRGQPELHVPLKIP